MNGKVKKESDLNNKEYCETYRENGMKRGIAKKREYAKGREKGEETP